MSFDMDPKWSNAVIYPSRVDCKCPYCEEPPRKTIYNEIIQPLKSATTYSIRHISPSLVFTCSNEKCEHCDEEYSINLRVTIEVAK